MSVTPWQTVGPFFNMGLMKRDETDLLSAGKGAPDGRAIELTGLVTQEDGKPVPSAVIEIWQANASGRYNHPDDDYGEPDPNFFGFGRGVTGTDGIFRFRTIMPGAVPGPGNALQAPHIQMSVHSAGLLRRLITRVYFDEYDAENAQDAVLCSIEDAVHRATLIAKSDGDADGATRFRFDIRLRGENETAFFID